MYQPSAPAQLDWMPQVKHFMIDEVFNGIARHAGSVKDAAYDDGVMRRIVMSQAAQGTVCRSRSFVVVRH